MLARQWVVVGILVLSWAGPGGAQEPEGRQPPSTSAEDALPADLPETPVRRLPTRRWQDTAQMTDAEIEEETGLLKQERTARTQAIAGFQETLREEEQRVRRNPTEAAVKRYEYRNALVGYRVAAENRELQQINARLQMLSQERTRRQGDAPVAQAARDLANVREAKAAMELLGEYDAALLEVLRREPFTEADLIYALGLMDEKAPVVEVVNAYFRLLEGEIAEHSSAEQAEEAGPSP